MDTKYEIEKNVPVPPRSKYPFEQMDVGDSFFTPLGPDQTIKRLQNTLSGAAGYFARNTEMNFVIRQANDGVRCWRIK